MFICISLLMKCFDTVKFFVLLKFLKFILRAIYFCLYLHSFILNFMHYNVFLLLVGGKSIKLSEKLCSHIFLNLILRCTSFGLDFLWLKKMADSSLKKIQSFYGSMTLQFSEPTNIFEYVGVNARK